MLKKYRKAVLRPCMCALIFLFSFVIIIFSCERLEIKRITKVSTGSVSGITALSSIVQGNVIEQGEGGIKQHGHCWSESSNPTISNRKTNLGARNTEGTFNSTLDELSPNTQYFVRAYAADNEGTTYGNEISFVTKAIPIPEAPGNLAADAESSSQITISWTDNSNNEEGFKIERSPDGSTNWVEIATVEANMTNFSNMGLSPSTQYCYRVRAFNAGGNSEPSGTACTTTKSDVPVPLAPTNLAADAESSSQITISWADNSDNEEGFKIERSPNGITGWVEIAVVEADTTNFQNINLDPETTYYYRVRAFNPGGSSDFSNSANATTLTYMPIPAAPTNLIVELVGSSQITFSWTDHANNEYGFKIERSLDGENWEQIAILGDDITTFQNRDLTPSTYYCYKVRAFNEGGDSDYSNTICTSTGDASFPDPPTNLIAEAVSSSQINLSWTDNSDNETGFEIERSPDGSTGWVEITDVGEGITMFTDIGLTPSTAYYYRVRAYNSGYTSDYSNTANATTLPEVSIPAAPTVLVATPITSSQITLRWTDNSVDEDGFIIERSPDGGTGWNEIGTVGNNTTIYDDMGLSPSTLYYYRVRAYNAGGNSDYSNMDDATTLSDIPVPAAPTNLVAEAISDSRIDLGWTDNADNEEGFRIERSSDGSYWEEIATVVADNSIFQNIDLSHSTPYYYRVRAYNAGGYSDYSNTANAETSLCPNTIIIDHIAGDVAPVTETNFRYGVVETNLSGENKCWLKQNLGAHHVAGGPTDDTEESAGWYWQFNLKQGYQHDGSTRTPGTTWIYPIDEASDWTADNDPCNLLFGRGWRIPTQMEWQNVDNNGGWNNFNDAYASDLKLHGSGVLVFHDGSLYYRGLGGAYWSSTQYDGANSYWLNIDNSNSRIEASYKSAGHSVRCIRD